MQSGFFHYFLLAALAGALLFAAFTDLRRRRIDNWLNAAIAVSAPLFWWSCGLSLWPDIAIQFAVTLTVFAVLAILFAMGAMGGGDVKLLTALALWVKPEWFLQLLLVMGVTGGLLTIFFGAWHVMRRQRDKLAIPYGVAIAVGGLWTLGFHYLPAAAQSLPLVG
jgi:prepilin peptidase CpaA